MRHLGIAFLAAALALTAGTPTGDIRGTVRFQDGSPLPFASVVILGTSMATITHQDGSFEFDGVLVGLVRLRITAAGWRGEKYHMVNVIAGTTTRADVQLTGHDLVREGIVPGPESSVPVARAALPIWPAPNIPGESPAGPAADAARADPLRPFTVDVPGGWFAEAADYSVMHYRDVFAIVNNRSPDLRITDKALPNGVANGLDTVAEQLEPGTVYIDFAFFEGPDRSARYRPGREDSFDRELAAFLKNPEAHSTSALDEYRLSFIKWGSQWDVRIYCRKPYTRQDRDLAFDVLRSIRFFERPIVNSAQAVGLAIQFLPPEAQIPKDSDDSCGAGEAWLANGGLQGNRSTRVTKTEEGFEVTFVLHEDNHGEGQPGEWHYLVRWDGSVEPR